MKKLMKDFISNEVKTDKITGGVSKPGDDTCSDAKGAGNGSWADDCEAEILPLIVLPIN